MKEKQKSPVWRSVRDPHRDDKEWLWGALMLEVSHSKLERGQVRRDCDLTMQLSDVSANAAGGSG